MSPRTLTAAAAAVLLLTTLAGAANAREPGPTRLAPKTLRVSAVNPRYFTDASGRAVYLTGSHVWWNLVGGRTWRVDCERGRAAPYDYGAHLRRLVAQGHNFIRFWRIEHTRWRECGDEVRIAPHPWRRTGPGLARDDLAKFDLRRLDPTYFRRLRNRVVAARRRNVYVSVMLFEGWSAQFADVPWRSIAHPFHRDNNVNGVDPDRDRNDVLTDIYTLRVPEVLRIQEAYVRKVLDTVGDLDNVLYEIVNESGGFSIRWQYHMIDFVKRYEARRGRRHPVGMTFVHHDGGSALVRSDADWVSPGDRRHLTDPPPASGRKVVISDTDHHCGGCGDGTFPWRTFTRGYNPIFMDEQTNERRAEEIRLAMGSTRRYAAKIDLVRMAPRGDLCSTGYCLVRPGHQYLVYAPRGGAFKLDLRAGAGRRYAVEWARPVSGASSRGRVVRGGAIRTLVPPFGGHAVAYLRRAR
jgi:hypothetical protein